METLASHHAGSLICYLTDVFAATAFKWTIRKNKNVVHLEIVSLCMNCLDRNVLKVASKARCNMHADDIDFSSNSFRKAAYCQYILWRYGRLGKGNRRVCPSCCVRVIRSVWPSADGNYTGFRAL